MHNLSCENEFYLLENEKSFPYQRMSTINLVLIERPGGTLKWSAIILTSLTWLRIAEP